MKLSLFCECVGGIVDIRIALLHYFTTRATCSRVSNMNSKPSSTGSPVMA